MRKVLRNKHAVEYWEDRWGSYSEDKDSFQNLEMYPVKFVENVVEGKKRILDAGCGLGRIVKHYHNNGFTIEGCELSKVAVDKLKKHNPGLKIVQGSITELPYENETFDLIVAFGVIHSIEHISEIEKAFLECTRCLTNEGIFVFSARADNWENLFIDKITENRGKKGDQFHKWCFTEKELVNLSSKFGLKLIKKELVTNVPFLHKYKWFRKYKGLNEGELREKGFKLNRLGNLLYGTLKALFPGKFGTTLVFTVQK